MSRKTVKRPCNKAFVPILVSEPTVPDRFYTTKTLTRLTCHSRGEAGPSHFQKSLPLCYGRLPTLSGYDLREIGVA